MSERVPESGCGTGQLGGQRGHFRIRQLETAADDSNAIPNNARFFFPCMTRLLWANCQPRLQRVMQPARQRNERWVEP